MWYVDNQKRCSRLRFAYRIWLRQLVESSVSFCHQHICEDLLICITDGRFDQHRSIRIGIRHLPLLLEKHSQDCCDFTESSQWRCIFWKQCFWGYSAETYPGQPFINGILHHVEHLQLDFRVWISAADFIRSVEHTHPRESAVRISRISSSKATRTKSQWATTTVFSISIQFCTRDEHLNSTQWARR